MSEGISTLGYLKVGRIIRSPVSWDTPCLLTTMPGHGHNSSEALLQVLPSNFSGTNITQQTSLQFPLEALTIPTIFKTLLVPISRSKTQHSFDWLLPNSLVWAPSQCKQASKMLRLIRRMALKSANRSFPSDSHLNLLTAFLPHRTLTRSYLRSQTSQTISSPTTLVLL